MTDETSGVPLARAAALRLAAASAIGGSVGTIAVGTGGLIGLSLLPPEQKALATVPVTAFVVGSTLASIPAALLMRQVGRRAGFVFGALVGAAGAALAFAAVAAQSFVWFSLVMVLLGAAAAFLQQYRFAAADASPPAYKPRAISWVMAGGVIAGIVGSQSVILGSGLVPGMPFGGPLLILCGLFLVTAAILAGLVVPPPKDPAETGGGRPLAEIVLKPKFLVALLAAVASFALMSLVMTATPLAMVEHHHSTADAALAIQWHVIAMFGPSFFTGALIARFGKSTIASIGLALIAASATAALSGTGLVHFWTALILLGLGWNFGFIAATAMVAELYRPEESFKVQAANEFVLFGCVAIASFSSGGLLSTGGWETINLILYPVTVVCIALIAMQSLAERRAAAV